MARKSESGAPRTPLQRAQAALQAGNVRLARQLAEDAAANGPPADREEARRFSRRLDRDLQPILAAAAVLILIILAAWLAILRHG